MSTAGRCRSDAPRDLAVHELPGNDAAAAVQDLKDQHDGVLGMMGSSQLSRTPIQAGLVDEYLLIAPVLFGGGKTVFSPNGEKRSLELVHTATAASGALCGVYRPGQSRRFRTGRVEPCPASSPTCGSTPRPWRPPSSTAASSRTPRSPKSVTTPRPVPGDQAEVARYRSALTHGGEEVQCGWLKDRYGLSWQIWPSELGEVLFDPDPMRAARAMRAMLAMVKIDTAAIRAAADG